MTSELTVPTVTAASIGAGHTLLGPDHYLPFVVLAQARGWSKATTVLITVLCGMRHVGSSSMLGMAGVALGVAVASVEGIESVRGDIAAWLLTAFGLVYMAWGLKRAARHRTHSHLHAHADGERHDHLHDHERAHLHPHDQAAAAPALTPWVLFTIFVFGPCEPLIPILMCPAAADSALGVALVAGVFRVATILTMLEIVSCSLPVRARALLMGVLDRVADRDEQPQAVGGVQPVAVAVVGDRNALDALHHEVRPSLIGGAGLEHPSDVGVVHEGERLAFRLEASYGLPAVHSPLDDLEGDAAADRALSLRLVDLPHPSLAELPQQPAGVDGNRNLGIGLEPGDPLSPTMLTLARLVKTQQRLHLVAQRVVAAARLVDPHGPIVSGPIEGLKEDLLGAVVELGRHSGSQRGFPARPHCTELGITPPIANLTCPQGSCCAILARDSGAL